MQILFVDDEISLLRSLERVFRRMDDEWNTHFTDTGEDAIQKLNESNFDIIVTDLRMPGMDGVQLLSRVQTKFPDMIRIILSGHSDRETLSRARQLAHKFISKPCPPTELKRILRETYEYRKSNGA